jgi:hypothetical protein
VLKLEELGEAEMRGIPIIVADGVRDGELGEAEARGRTPGCNKEEGKVRELLEATD